jgi:hypothetical protein
MHTSLRFDRRKATRYELNFKLRYMIYGSDRRVFAGSGQTVNLSSTGLCFRSDKRVLRGDWIKAAVEWPVSSPRGDSLILLIAGYVVRTKALSAAILIEKRDLVPAAVLAETVSASPEKMKSYPIRPIILVNEDNRSFGAVSIVAGDYPYPIHRADAAAIKEILTAGFPPVRLLITSSLEPLAGIPVQSPVIYTGGRAESGLPGGLELPKVIAVDRPLVPEQLRTVLASVLAPRVNSGSDSAT